MNSLSYLASVVCHNVRMLTNALAACFDTSTMPSWMLLAAVLGQLSLVDMESLSSGSLA